MPYLEGIGKYGFATSRTKSLDIEQDLSPVIQAMQSEPSSNEPGLLYRGADYVTDSIGNALMWSGAGNIAIGAMATATGAGFAVGARQAVSGLAMIGVGQGLKDLL